MIDETLEPMDDDLAALLEQERSAKAPAAALERVWQTFASGGAGPPPAPRRLGWLASHALPVALVAFVLGGAAGAALEARFAAAPAERVVRVYVPAPAPSSPEPPATPAEPAPPAPATAAPAPPRASAVAAPAASSSLSAERLLLDQARSALTAEQPDRALALLTDHVRRFPRPQLGEEREALAIQALAASGRFDEARERGARFRASTPNSLFLPAVEATLASIP